MNVVEKIRTRFSSEAQMDAEEITHLEARLQHVFVPVAPRRDFIERLNKQLITSAPLARQTPAPLIERPNRDNLLLGVATLFGFAMMFATGFRIAVTFLGALGVAAQWMSRRSGGKQSPAQPVA